MEWTECERTCLSDCRRVSMGVLRYAGRGERGLDGMYLSSAASLRSMHSSMAATRK